MLNYQQGCHLLITHIFSDLCTVGMSLIGLLWVLLGTLMCQWATIARIELGYQISNHDSIYIFSSMTNQTFSTCCVVLMCTHQVVQALATQPVGYRFVSKTS